MVSTDNNKKNKNNKNKNNVTKLYSAMLCMHIAMRLR